MVHGGDRGGSDVFAQSSWNRSRETCKCSSRTCTTKDIFRQEKILKNGAMHAIAYGKYCECRFCQRKVKILLMLYYGGAQREIVIRLGEEREVNGKTIAFTEEEAGRIWG